MATKILTCTCKHELQDKLHGHGQRVFNSTSKQQTFRCTVCKKERILGEPIAKGKK